MKKIIIGKLQKTEGIIQAELKMTLAQTSDLWQNMRNQKKSNRGKTDSIKSSVGLTGVSGKGWLGMTPMY